MTSEEGSWEVLCLTKHSCPHTGWAHRCCSPQHAPTPWAQGAAGGADQETPVQEPTGVPLLGTGTLHQCQLWVFPQGRGNSSVTYYSYLPEVTLFPCSLF